ncbi:hypothetical protein ASE07_00235 [Noviherbaspirillum sp. Root189]|nr:hypothetical protein ASE07_00235 [Noviherbaspirillum sp. Root189]
MLLIDAVETSPRLYIFSCNVIFLQSQHTVFDLAQMHQGGCADGPLTLRTDFIVVYGQEK